MKPPATHQRLLAPTALAGLIGLALALPPVAARTDELRTGGGARGLVVHGADETLRDYCTRDADGRLWLTLPGGARFELITSTTDPAITNPGDGAFHPFEFAEVQAALATVRFPLQGVRADIFILPCPRRSGLESAAGPQLMLLSPGVRPVSPQQQHAEFVHELGHVVQYALMPDADESRWQDYRRLRGIQDETVYSPSAAHANRPHEIFAEDFRALFGGSLATYSRTIENSSIRQPAEVPGLDRFMLDLGSAFATTRLAVSPNPARSPLRFSRPDAIRAPLDLFDAAGRRLTALEPTAGGGEWIWDGRDASGRPVPAGVVFARVRGVAGPAVRITLLP
jgi:hypothetical protein